VGLTSQANAGLLLDPYISQSLYTNSELGGVDADLMSTVVGTRVAYTSELGFAGLDFSVAEETFSPDVPMAQDTEATTGRLGAVVGFQTKEGFRGYFEYLLLSRVAVKNSNGVEIDGTGFKFGFGYAVLKWLTVNLEFTKETYDKATDNSNTANLTNEIENDMALLSVSFPFVF
jgi:hypothetical protein